MKAIINKVFQILMDIVIGVAINFGLKAFIPVLNDNTVFVIAVVGTAVFAEVVETRLKK